MPNTKTTGDVSEAVVLARFLEAGFPVLLPFGDNQRYDMVVEDQGRFLRVQVKTAYVTGWKGDGACLRFNARSTNPPERSSLSGYRGQADLFAVYSPHTREVYVLSVDECGGTEVWLRMTPARNNQHRHVRHAEDYTLAAWVSRTTARGRKCSAGGPSSAVAAPVPRNSGG